MLILLFYYFASNFALHLFLNVLYLKFFMLYVSNNVILYLCLKHFAVAKLTIIIQITFNSRLNYVILDINPIYFPVSKPSMNVEHLPIFTFMQKIRCALTHIGVQRFCRIHAHSAYRV